MNIYVQPITALKAGNRFFPRLMHHAQEHAELLCNRHFPQIKRVQRKQKKNQLSLVWVRECARVLIVWQRVLKKLSSIKIPSGHNKFQKFNRLRYKIKIYRPNNRGAQIKPTYQLETEYSKRNPSILMPHMHQTMEWYFIIELNTALKKRKKVDCLRIQVLSHRLQSNFILFPSTRTQIKTKSRGPYCLNQRNDKNNNIHIKKLQSTLMYSTHLEKSNKYINTGTITT